MTDAPRRTRLIDLTGQTFGRLTVLAREPQNKHGKPLWRCRCDCGRVVSVLGNSMRMGHTKSCGCLNLETISNLTRTHGATHTPEFRTWCAMLTRCGNPNQKAFRYYGARGIRVCDRWRHSFENFLADMGPRPPGMSIDRIDNDGNYEPGNCRWTDRATQNINKRRYAPGIRDKQGVYSFAEKGLL